MHDSLVPDDAVRRAPPRAAAPHLTSLQRLPRGAWLAAAVLAAFAVHLALWQVSEPEALFSDFFKAYFPAGEVLWEDGWHAPFPFTEVGAGGFVNLPVVGWLFVPFVPMGEDAAGWAFLALGAAATVGAYLLMLRLVEADTRTAAVLAVLFLLNGPLINTLREGNVTHFMLLLLIVALGLLQRRADFAAGLVLGLCAVIKLPLLLYGVYFLLRGRWRVVAGGAAAILAVVALSLATFGLAKNLNWFGCCIEPFLGGVIPAFNVQSIDGFAVRLVTGTAQLMSWDPVQPPAAYKLLRMVIFAGLLAATVLLGWRSTRSAVPAPVARERELIEFCLVLTLALVLSPISWSHYFAWLLIPWSLYLGGRLPLIADAPTRRLLWLSIGLASLPIVVLPLQPDLLGETLARTVISVTFFGGIAMLAALLRGLHLLTPPAPAPAMPARGAA